MSFKRQVLRCLLPVVGLVTSTTATAGLPAPVGLEPPATATLMLTTHGVGVQIYTCQPATDDPERFSWTLSSPEAKLTGDDGRLIGKHYAGPTWEANDGSKVVGDVVARDNGPDSSAIPWLLLRAKSTSGPGRFSTVTFIQRLHTAGGKAPAAGCTTASAGHQLRVNYSADYRFYVSGGSS